MFHPSMVCSIRPFQQSCLICSLKNSAMPCFIRRSKVVVALAPSRKTGSFVSISAENSASTGSPSGSWSWSGRPSTRRR